MLLYSKHLPSRRKLLNRRRPQILKIHSHPRHICTLAQLRASARHSSIMGNRKAQMDKIAMLKEILGQQPGDAFARYGLAMAYAAEGEANTALTEFDRLLREHPDYTAGYFMAAQTLVKAARPWEAQIRLREGIASAQRTGNQHALSEMQQLLDELDDAERED
jgi:predicted Zn-dependent protease